MAVVAALPAAELVIEMLRRALRDEFAFGARIGRREVEEERGIRNGAAATARDLA